MNSKMTLSARAFLLTVGMLVVLYWYTSDVEIQARVYPVQQVVGQPVRYIDSTSQAEQWHWEFGDGQESPRARGVVRYYRPGTYLIRLRVNKEVTRTFSVVIRPEPMVIRQDSLVQIQGPSTGYEREKLVFTAVGGRASQFTWRFGASGQVDSRDQTAIYSYPADEDRSKPHTYTIELMTDVTKYPIRKQITIIRGYNKFDPPIDSLDIVGSDIRRRLQQIADGQSFNSNYNYLLSKYLCNRNNSLVQINNTKANDFYSYCMGLQFDQGVHIDGVAVVSDSVTSCITRLNVTQHKP
ncbi:PKD domain-containing protein [Spirosoma litoris]